MSAGRAVRTACWTVVLGVVGVQLWRMRDGVAGALGAVGPGPMVLSGLLAGLGAVGGMLGWRVLLAGLGSPLPLPVAARVYFVGGLGKYLPGGLWPALAHADAARSLRQPPARLAGAFLGSAALSVLAGLVVGLLAVPRLVAADPLWWLLLPVLAAALVPVLAPGVLGAALRPAARLLHRAPPPLPDRRHLVAGTALMVGGWLVTGLHVTVLAGALGVGPGAALTVVVGGCALASVLGMVAVVLPAGLGARELVLGLTLATVLPTAAVVAVVALSRLIATVADVAVAALALALVRLPDLTDPDIEGAAPCPATTSPSS